MAKLKLAIGCLYVVVGVAPAFAVVKNISPSSTVSNGPLGLSKGPGLHSDFKEPAHLGWRASSPRHRTEVSAAARNIAAALRCGMALNLLGRSIAVAVSISVVDVQQHIGVCDVMFVDVCHVSPAAVAVGCFESSADRRSHFADVILVTSRYNTGMYAACPVCLLSSGSCS